MLGATEKIFDNPQNPYTQMLMASVPRLDKKWEEGQADIKTVKSQADGGCVFFSRCPVAESICATYNPALLETESDHSVACIHYEEV